jgi:SAM-dependent methyltransferase
MKAESAGNAYGSDLAYIHDAGFGAFAEAAAQTLLALLRRGGVRGGLVVDLGCGSGILASVAATAGYDVLGFDISPNMVELSRRRVRRGTFRRASLLDAEIPSCVAVTAVGEIFNYLFDRRHSLARLKKLFRRVHRALAPGGLFLFDVALIGRVPEGWRRSYTEADDWACLFEAEENARQKLLTRRITTFRKVGGAFRRDHEVHRLRLFERDELLAPLRKLGFRVRTVRRYGELSFPPGYVGFIARKS